MQLNKKQVSLYLVLIIVAIIAAISIFYRTEVTEAYHSIKSKYTNGSELQHASTEPIKVELNQEIDEEISQVWNNAMEKHQIDHDEWISFTLSDLKTIDEQASKHFQKDSKSSMKTNVTESEDTFQESLASGIMNALSQHMQKGDSKPIILVSTKSREVKVGFQRNYGEGEYVMMTLKEQYDEKVLTRSAKTTDKVQANLDPTNTIKGVFWSDIIVSTVESDHANPPISESK
ncbi:MAG TPA: hypothetical protein VNS08_17915 [Ureibacillus sp.]|nr:hypothetical protein [Ureibacillus sp.]